MPPLPDRFQQLSPDKQLLLRRRLEELRNTRTAERREITPREPSSSVPLTYAQERIWLDLQLHPEDSTYHRPANVRLSGTLDLEALRASLDWIIARQDALRMRVVAAGDTAHAVIHDHCPVVLELVDLSDEERSNGAEAVVAAIVRQEVDRPFRLDSEPPVRFKLLRLRDRDHRLLVTFHHLVFDALSQSVFLRELASAYAAFTSGGLPETLPLSIQYPDFAAWENHPDRIRELEPGRRFWHQRLENPPQLDWPRTSGLHDTANRRVAWHDFTIAPDLAADLKRTTQQAQVTLFSALLATYLLALSRYTGQNDIIVGVPTANRGPAELAPLIGVFINTLPVRLELQHGESTGDFLRRAHQRILEALSHQEVPMQWMVRDVARGRNSLGISLIETLFVHERLSNEKQRVGDLVIEAVDTPVSDSPVGITLETWETAEGLRARISAQSRFLDGQGLVVFSEHYTTLLTNLVEDLDRPVQDLSMVSMSERERLLVAWNHTTRDYPREACVHQFFEEQVARTPEAVAVICGDRQLTYEELNTRANRLAHHLQKLGVGPETIVGLCLDRSVDLSVAILGIFKAGGAYLPLDADHPRQRIDFMVRDSQARYLVTSRSLLSKLPPTECTDVCLDRDAEILDAQDAANPGLPADSRRLAYVLFTSGSTGEPKGVMVEHRSVVNLITGLTEQLGFDKADRILSITTPLFDISVLELLLPIVAGGSVEVVPAHAVTEPRALIERLDSGRITMMQATPASWRMLVQGGWQGTPGLKALTGGEALDDDLARELSRRCKTLWNLYGPTETTVYSTGLQVIEGKVAGSIGRPIANTQAYVLDDRRNPTPIGVAGELYLGGDGLARGYLHRPELTFEKFVPDPFSDDPSARLYRTGDLCRWRHDGTLEFLGRIDGQIKLRGFRIELGEIESALRLLPHVAQAVVVLREDQPGDQRLAAYCVPSPGEQLSPPVLRQHLREHLPDYMVPASFTTLDALPLTTSGKINRRALPVPDRVSSSAESRVPPRNPLEEQLAAIWRDLLGIEQVGVHDNFFELGGHSLLAVRLFTRIERQLGRRLPMSLVFSEGTIAGLATHLERPAEQAPLITVLPLRGVGAGRPLFVMPGLSGSLLFFKAILDRMPHEFPVLGIQPALAPENIEVFRDFQQTARVIAKTITAHQSEGPYALTGYSYGAPLAYEVARQLSEAGGQVDVLALIDSGPGQRGMQPTWRRRIMSAWRILTNLPLWVVDEANHFSFRRLRQTTRRWARKIFRSLRYGNAARSQPEDDFNYIAIPAQNRELLQAAYEAFRRYRPSLYRGRLTLIRARVGPLLRAREYDLGWGRYTREVDVRPVEGNHESILRSPHCEAVARVLGELMDSSKTSGARGRRSMQPTAVPQSTGRAPRTTNAG